uniref:Uncharacterized protein n=1 Tax=Eutreptiella gymnastica TaxID=73025 RepID=A0A7S1J8I3_9EUGL
MDAEPRTHTNLVFLARTPLGHTFNSMEVQLSKSQNRRKHLPFRGTASLHTLCSDIINTSMHDYILVIITRNMHAYALNFASLTLTLSFEVCNSDPKFLPWEKLFPFFLFFSSNMGGGTGADHVPSHPATNPGDALC